MATLASNLAPHTATSSPTRSGIARRELPQLVWFTLFAMIVGSSVVLIEPAPCDIVFVIFAPLLIATGHFVFMKSINKAILLGLSLFLVMNVISLANSFDVALSARYFAITVYLVAFWLLIISLLGKFGETAFCVIRDAMLIAAFIAAVIGILAKFQVVPNWQIFILDYQPGANPDHLRIRSTFKDANVLGPYLAAAVALILTEVTVMRRVKWWQIGCIFVYFVAIILTYSRGAYLACVVSWTVLAVLFWWVPRYRDSANAVFIRLIPLGIIFLVVVIIGLIASGWFDYFLQRFAFQEYDNERFFNHQQIIESFGEVPLGLGPGSWNKYSHLYLHDVHSLFLRTWVENSIVGLAGLLIFLFAWCGEVWQAIARGGKYVHIHIVCLAVFLGIMSNSFSIDTIHWRHLFLFMAIPLGMIIFEKMETHQNAEFESQPDDASAIDEEIS